MSRRKLIIIAAVISLVAIGAAVAIFWPKGAETDATAAAGVNDGAYIEVPPMIVNLRSSDAQQRFLKLRFIIVAKNPAQSETIKARLPFVLDALQPFLRELRPEDLNGSAAVFRVKEEMMSRMVTTLGPDVVRDVLIQDLVQQ